MSSSVVVRVLHLIPYMHPSAGGPPVVVEQWCVELNRLDIQSEVLTTNAYSQGESNWIDAYRSKFSISVLNKFGPNGFGFGWGMRRQLRKQLDSVDLVHVHNVWGYTNRIAASECAARDVPFLVSPHGMLDPNSMSRKGWKKRLYGRLVEFPGLCRSSAMVYTHQKEMDLALATVPTLPAGYIVPLGTEDPPPIEREALANEFRARDPKLGEGPIVLFLGRIHPKKGLDLLVPAFSQVLARFPRARLELVGPGDEAYVTTVRRQIEALRLSESVDFVGSLRDRAKWAALAAADVFVLPSYQENFGIALVEALRVGTPVICSNNVNLCEDLVGESAALQCEMDVTDVGDKICEVLKNRDEANRLGDRGRRYAEQHFTWQKSARELASVYASVLRRHGISKRGVG